MIEVVNYKPEFLARLKPRAIHAGELSPEIRTQAIALLRGDVVLSVYGGAWLCPGVMHLWAFISDEVRKCPIEFHKKTLEYLGLIHKIEGLRRLQMDVRVEYDMGCRWAESIGFKREGIMKGYAPGDGDSYLYGKQVLHVGN